jgi:hypothetical protein
MASKVLQTEGRALLFAVGDSEAYHVRLATDSRFNRAPEICLTPGLIQQSLATNPVRDYLAIPRVLWLTRMSRPAEF